MAKYKKYSYSQTMLLPVSLQEQLMPGTLEFAIHTLVESRMDMSRFDVRFANDETGRSAYDPKILLKAVLLAYSRGILTSRKIEQACRENVVFMAMTCGQRPDHSTIAAFVSTMKEEIQPLFRDVLLICHEMNLLGGTEFALDGCKLPSNASKEWSGTKDDLRRKKEKLEGRVQELLDEQIKADIQEKQQIESDKSRQTRQVEKLQRQAERIGKWLQENQSRIGRQGKEIKSNITDNESAKMTTAHGVVQGYNGQALVDSKRQVIVQAEVFGNGQDHYHVPPLLDGARENMKAIGQAEDYFEGAVFTADTNYHSDTNIRKCQQEKLDAYIPDRFFRKRDPRFATQERHRSVADKKFRHEDFQYNEAEDCYICPQGEVLSAKKTEIAENGNLYKTYVGDEGYCGGCVVRRLCLQSSCARKKWMRVLLKTFRKSPSQEMAEKIDTPRGRRLYPHRIAIVEPVFANLRTQKRLDRFTLRGKIKVNIQWLLYCMVHNIEKIARYGCSVASG